jgi:hypothetical protein
MIVLSVGMPRAGSGWHYNLIHDLMKTQGSAEATEIRERFHLEKVLTEVNCNIGVLSLRRLALVSVPAFLGHSFVIKAHSRPTSPYRILRAVGLVRATYIYRDPRDAMLSAMNYGERALEKDRPNAFSHLADFGTAVDFMDQYLRVWDAWMTEKGVLTSRYEDLLQNYDSEALRLGEFLGLDSRQIAVQAAINRFRPEQAGGHQGTHFFKGRIGRFREAFSSEQQAILAQRFGPHMERMGYSR